METHVIYHVNYVMNVIYYVEETIIVSYQTATEYLMLKIETMIKVKNL